MLSVRPGHRLKFLELLNPRPDGRVLEIGTGTGWTAALLSHRIGEHAVTSVEIDQALMDVASGNLKAAGYAPTLIVGDGADGYPAGAPFDGIHVTCGASEIPQEWVRQLRPGGVVVLPWMPTPISGYRVRLVAHDDGTAVGTFHGSAGYMMLRSQRHIRPWHATGDADQTSTRLVPRDLDQPGVDLALLAAVPVLITRVIDHPETDESEMLLWEMDGDSWAEYDYEPGSPATVYQHGPRRIWDEVEAAYLQWQAAGSPGPERFRLTVTPEGQRLTRL